MLKENQYIQVKWNSNNKKHLISQGYIFTKMYDTITIKAEDLSNGSKAKVVCLCDYCGQEIIKPYYDHITRGDCCNQCRYLKVKENNLKKYGVESTSQLQSVKDKTKQTNLSKYGCTCTVHNAIIQKKVKQTNIERYGNEYYFGSEQGKLDIQNIIDNRTQEEKDVIKHKREQTCLNKYGAKNVFELKEFQQKVVETNLDKYGVPYAIMDSDVKEKQIDSMIHNQHNRKSKQETKCYNIVKKLYDDVQPSQRCSKYTLDCVINYQNHKIDVEYDGWYWHKNMIEYDNIRNNVVQQNGYDIIRIQSDGKMPTKQQIQQAVQRIINGEKLVYIDIKNHTQS
jgi:very-short-patch-repair endonuclease